MVKNDYMQISGWKSRILHFYSIYIFLPTFYELYLR